MSPRYSHPGFLKWFLRLYLANWFEVSLRGDVMGAHVLRNVGHLNSILPSGGENFNMVHAA